MTGEKFKAINQQNSSRMTAIFTKLSIIAPNIDGLNSLIKRHRLAGRGGPLSSLTLRTQRQMYLYVFRTS